MALINSKNYVHYGCANSAPIEWTNFDVSPTLRIQKIPILGNLLKPKLNIIFPDNVLYGNIIEGLPIPDKSCDGVYCSHTLEHLSLSDFRKALLNTYKILKPGGIFRCIVPDMETYAREYVHDLDSGKDNAIFAFMEKNLLGIEHRPRGIKQILSSFLGNSHHLWMWDTKSLSSELKKVGFQDIRTCEFNDSEDKMFIYVENIGRFEKAVCIECKR